MSPTFRERLSHNDLVIGTLVTLAAPEIAEILAGVGFDWLWIDMEHSPLDPRASQAILQAAAGRVACVLRVPLNDEIWIKKALDIGADGIIVPMVNTAEIARRAVMLSKYPPQGSRSVGVARAQGYGAHLANYMQTANQQTAVIVQAEHIQAVENINSILEVEGVDAVLVGPYDLSASMGLIGQVEHPRVQEAILRVRQACQARGMPLGVFVAGAERAQAYIDEGYRLVAAGVDTMLLAQAAGAIVDRLHQARGI